MRYIVMLRDCNQADSAAVSIAVDRFRRELDRWLGSRIERAFLAFQRACDSTADDLAEADIALAIEFGAAYQAAHTAGLAGITEPGNAHFDIQPCQR